MSSQQRYANVANPHVNALVTGRYRFETEGQALKKMEFIKDSFTTARNQAPEDMPEDKECLVLWINDYAVSPVEEEDGFLGNYAFVTPEQLDNGVYTLTCVKLDTELKYHPRRKRPKTRLPNWGHPILRAVKKQKRYPTIESIQAELDQLHMEFPDTTIPGDNKLLLMIFDRKTDPKNPAQKYILKLVAHPDGGFTFEYKLNDYQGRMGPMANAKQDNVEQAEEAPQGYFTSMVALKRKRKPGPGGAAGGGDANQS